MKSVLSSVLCLLSVAACAATDVLRTTKDVNAFLETSSRVRAPFTVEGVVYHTAPSSILLQDDTGRVWINFAEVPQRPRVGDRVVVSGSAFCTSATEPLVCVTNVIRLERTDLPPPLRLRLGEIDIKRHRLARVETSGLVVEAFADDQDPDYSIVVLKDGACTLPVFIHTTDIRRTQKLIDARISVSGIYQQAVRGIRKYSGPFIDSQRVTVVEEPPANPFDVPDLEKTWYMTPADISALGRRKIRGEALAVWNDCRLLVREDGSRIVNVSMLKGAKMPAPGEAIEVVGYPRTDLFRLNLGSARWRPLADAPSAPRTPDRIFDISPRDVVRGTALHKIISEHFHGQVVRLRGIVRSLPAAEGVDRRLYLDSDGFKVPVDVSSCPAAADGIEIGGVVEVTGRCFIETSEWSSNEIFPQATGFAVIARSADDFRVVSRPPWWTRIAASHLGTNKANSGKRNRIGRQKDPCRRFARVFHLS